MGFEQFRHTDGNREDKVMALAKLLHQRGLTSSMSSAKRLAEGMVEVEKKIIKAPEVAPAQPTASFHDEKLPGDFLHFIEHAAKIQHEEVQQTVTVTERKKEEVTAYTPKSSPTKQIFFDDAPDLTKARGYSGPKFQTPEFHSQKVLARQEQELKEAQKIEEAAIIETPEQKISEPVAESTAEAMPATPAPEVTPETAESASEPAKPTVAETVIATLKNETTDEFIAETPAEPAQAEPQEPAEAAPPEQVTETTIVTPEPEQAPAVPVEQATPEAAPKVDLAKQHGVDLFEMFKKK